MCSSDLILFLPEVHKAEVNVLHSDLSCAIFSMEPHVHSFCFSRLMVRRQVSFGLPRDLFPSGVHLRAIFAAVFLLIQVSDRLYREVLRY